jgi:G3E family GTPase
MIISSATTTSTTSSYNKIPVTLLCGFLGSGKTTLIRQIITRSPKPVAIIENEYSPNGSVERVLATFDTKYQNSDLFLELPNGCVCCTVKDSLVETLELLLQRKSDFSHIVLELSGLADPGPLASIFWLDDELQSPLILDGIVCMIDAQNFDHTSETQLAYADRILINKIDLVSKEKIQEITSTIRTRYPNSTLMETSLIKEEIPLDFILQVHSVEPRNMIQSLLLHHSHHDPSSPDGTKPLMTTITLTRDKPLDTNKFRSWIGGLIWGVKNDIFAIYRVKGIIESSEDHSAYVVQAVHDILDYKMLSEKFSSTGMKSSTVILIGKGLNEIELTKQFIMV